MTLAPDKCCAIANLVDLMDQGQGLPTFLDGGGGGYEQSYNIIITNEVG